jgi:uncharacterized protein YxjI
MKLPTLKIKKEFTVKNADNRKKWCICGKTLTIPEGTVFENCRLVSGELSDRYSVYQIESNIVLQEKGKFVRGKGMHLIVADFKGLQPYI